MTTPTQPDAPHDRTETARADPGVARVGNPFKRGQAVLIPAGTPIRSTQGGDKGRKNSGRNNTVTAYFVHGGHVDLWNDYGKGLGYVILPEVTWAGTGGYWHTVQVTPELCAANGVPAPVLPGSSTLSLIDASHLDVEPSYGTGYDNRYAWSA